MPMAVIFAEIAAAELAAAAAAEAAAVTAAEVAAAEAASIAAAEAASTAAAQAATQAAAQQATTTGIMEVGGATANPALTAEAVQNAAVNSGADLTAKGSFNPSNGQFINTTLPPEPVFQNVGGQGVTTPQTFPVNDGGITSVPQAAPPVTPPAAPPVNTMGLEMPGAYAPPSNYPMGMDGQFTANQFIEPGSAGMPSMENTIAQANVPVTPPSGLEAGFDKALKFAEKNPFTAMTGAYMGASALGLLNPSGATFNNKPYDGPLSKYKLSPNFQGATANPANFQYNPATNRRYAGGGGIMGANAYDIPVGYDEGGPVALPLPSRTMRSSDAFQVPGQPQDASQFPAADAYNDILRNRATADLASGRRNDPMYGVADARQLETRANTPERGFGPMIAGNELLKRSNEGEFAAPGYGDLGQFAGSFDPANVPMGNNRLSPVDQYKAIAYDTAIMDGTAPIMPRDKSTTIANLASDSDAGRFGVPGYGDQGQFFGSFNSLKDDNPYNVDAFAKGGSLSDSISAYQKMLGGQQQAAPTKAADVGIYYDQDPDTRYQDALTAAQIRQAKVNQRAYVSPPVAKRPTPLGKLDMPTSAKSKESSSGDVEARHGGIMHSSLGSYAAGGNPRLLKGPGDGMSDNIPATINGRQPARLADGEFVIPADVVSHLGNGSTEAGAKQLHAMMNNIRKARTGNPKQGKQINAKKYMPK